MLEKLTLLYELYKNVNIEKKRKIIGMICSYIPEPIRKIVGGFKDKVAGLFKTNTPKQIVYGRGKKLRKPQTQNSLKKT